MPITPVLAVIPARAGSKGLPRKNVLSFAGLPLIAHSIKFAGMCPQITRCIVSTESEEIADVARAHGGDVPFLRPAELAEDSTPMLPVLQNAVSRIEQLESKTYGSVLLLQPPSPVRAPADITRAIALLESDSNSCGVVGVAEPPFNPAHVCVWADSEYLKSAFAGADAVRRQDAPAVYRITGSLYLWRRDYIANATDIRMSEDPHRMLVIPKERAFDIDDAHDFRMAELAVTSGLIELPWLHEKPLNAGARKGVTA